MAADDGLDPDAARASAALAAAAQRDAQDAALRRSVAAGTSIASKAAAHAGSWWDRAVRVCTREAQPAVWGVGIGAVIAVALIISHGKNRRMR